MPSNSNRSSIGSAVFPFESYQFSRTKRLNIKSTHELSWRRDREAVLATATVLTLERAVIARRRAVEHVDEPRLHQRLLRLNLLDCRLLLALRS